MRSVQHIAPLHEAEDAILHGDKVEMLCGKRRYPMRGMGDHIPTCSVCSKKALEMVETGEWVWRR